MDIKIEHDKALPGTSPVVCIGPNGAGKTRHAAEMVTWNDADLIAALRNIALPPEVPMSGLSQARDALTSQLHRRRSRPWLLSDEINQLFGKLLAEDSASALRFRDAHALNSAVRPETSTLMTLSEVWPRLFPGRSIDFSEHRPRIRSDYGAAAGEYPAQQMSDGERVALYLAGRVLDSDSKVIIVDEPEVHFHSRLAARFWNEMESRRPEVRFVYITHDLPFALSRREATYVVIMPNASPQVVSLAEGLPADLAQSLLGAASFSIHATRIVFCEGAEEGSKDMAIYSAWFREEDTAVIPVGSGKDVVRCAVSFGESTLVAGVTAIGIVDRDHWSSEYLDKLPDSVFALKVHEVENLLCIREVFIAVAEHQGLSDVDAMYGEFMKKAAMSFSEGHLAKVVSDRFRRRCEYEFDLCLGTLVISPTLSEMETQHVEALQPASWATSPATLFEGESALVQAALSSPIEGELLRYLPGKAFLRIAAEKLGMSTIGYMTLVCSALQSDRDTDSLWSLGQKLERCLAQHLPPRMATGSAQE